MTFQEGLQMLLDAGVSVCGDHHCYERADLLRLPSVHPDLWPDYFQELELLATGEYAFANSVDVEDAVYDAALRIVDRVPISGRQCPVWLERYFLEWEEWRAGGRRRPDLVSAEWRAMRARVITQDGAICAYCGDACDGDPTVDHVVPYSRGGTMARSNLVVACRPCNTSKGNKTLKEWRGRQ